MNTFNPLIQKRLKYNEVPTVGEPLNEFVPNASVRTKVRPGSVFKLPVTI